MRTKIIAANWKMYKNTKETISFLKNISSKLKDVNNKEIIIAPSFTSLEKAKEYLYKNNFNNVKLACQNINSKDYAALTGEISPLMVKDFVNYAIVGHSERRIFFNETNKIISEKLISAFKHNLIPILCIGETKEERENNNYKDAIITMLKKSLENVDKEDIKKIIVAYEPIWAISNGDPSTIPATPEIAQEMHLIIRNFFKTIINEYANNIRILYGGSVKEDNIKEFMNKDDIDGVLVGGASLDFEKFEKIIKYDY
ncbi:MAG: triose-phosphate isomerase [Candidatus Woesearchaeota archaeon]